MSGGLFGSFVRAKVRRAIHEAQYILGDRSELTDLEPVRLPFGYERIYHFHIRKTAGTSLNFSFRNAFCDGFCGSEGEAALFKRRWTVHGGRVYVTHSEFLVEQGNYFYADGHSAWHEVKTPENTFKITIVRDPMKRVLSHYRMLRHWRANDVQHRARKEEERYLGNSFSDFLDRVPRQHLMRQLYMFSRRLDVAEATKNIKKMNFIMVTEEFSEHLRALSALLQIDLRPYKEKSSYGAVEITESDRARLGRALEPEYRFLEAVRPLAGMHLAAGCPVRADAPVDAGAVVLA